MRAAASLAISGLLRSPARALTRVLVVAAAVGLLGATLLFIGNSLRTMAGSTIRTVPIDWQGPVGSYAEAQRVAAEVARQRGVTQASAAATAPFSGVTHSGPAGVSSAGAGSVLAVSPGYEQRFPVYRILQGRSAAGQVLLDQQLAATLQARIGDRVTITPRVSQVTTNWLTRSTRLARATRSAASRASAIVVRSDMTSERGRLPRGSSSNRASCHSKYTSASLAAAA